MTARPSLNWSVIIATAHREGVLGEALRKIAAQSVVPAEVVVVDGAPAPGAEAVVADARRQLGLTIIYTRSSPPSAAVQRNVGTELAAGDVLVFMDDDVYPEADCFEKMAQVLDGDSTSSIGGVGVLISNQPCAPPSRRAKLWLDFLAGTPRSSYSGAVIGPAINIGPEPTSDARIVPVEWLASTCVAYRRAALPAGGFESQFRGYSYMEDVDLSVRVARRFTLVVHTGAYVYHDSQPSRFKLPFERARMTVENRHYVMTRTLGRSTAKDHLKFVAAFGMVQVVSLRDVRQPRDLVAWFQKLGGTLTGLGCVAARLAMPARERPGACAR